MAKVAGYSLEIQNWYARPSEDFPYACISSSDGNSTLGDEGAVLYKQTFSILEIPERDGFVSRLDGRRVGEPYYETLDDAKQALRELGVKTPQFGFNAKE